MENRTGLYVEPDIGVRFGKKRGVFLMGYIGRAETEGGMLDVSFSTLKEQFQGDDPMILTPL